MLRKRIASAFLTLLMLLSVFGFVSVFLPKKEAVEFKPIWEEPMPDDIKAAYIQRGITVVTYPGDPGRFAVLPNLTRGYVVLEKGTRWAISSLNGFRETNESMLVKDLCELMPVKALPDCLLE